MGNMFREDMKEQEACAVFYEAMLATKDEDKRAQIRLEFRHVLSFIIRRDLDGIQRDELKFD